MYLTLHLTFAKFSWRSGRLFFGPLLFLIYINDLNTAIKPCKVHYLADDTNLLNINDPIQKLNKAVNSQLTNL